MISKINSKNYEPRKTTCKTVKPKTKALICTICSMTSLIAMFVESIVFNSFHMLIFFGIFGLLYILFLFSRLTYNLFLDIFNN